jgi:hypothetical protein
LKAALNFRGVATARGGQWTAVQVGAILRRVGHFTSGRLQQTTNKRHGAIFILDRQQNKQQTV